jgi:hypothetical protein
LTARVQTNYYQTMKCAYRSAVVTCLLLLGATFAGALDDFDSAVDFSVTLKALSGIDEAAARVYGLKSRYLVLDGTVTGIQFLNQEEEGFQAQMELAAGEWIGLEEVRSYRCYVLFQGRRFFRLLPRRAPRSPDPSVVVLNDRVLVVARALRLVQEEGGEPVWLLEGLHARPLR